MDPLSLLNPCQKNNCKDKLNFNKQPNAIKRQGFIAAYYWHPIFKNNIFILNIYLFLIVCVCHSTCVTVRGQLVGKLGTVLRSASLVAGIFIGWAALPTLTIIKYWHWNIGLGPKLLSLNVCPSASFSRWPFLIGQRRIYYCWSYYLFSFSLPMFGLQFLPFLFMWMYLVPEDAEVSTGLMEKYFFLSFY